MDEKRQPLSLCLDCYFYLKNVEPFFLAIPLVDILSTILLNTQHI